MYFRFDFRLFYDRRWTGVVSFLISIDIYNALYIDDNFNVSVDFMEYGAVDLHKITAQYVVIEINTKYYILSMSS